VAQAEDASLKGNRLLEGLDEAALARIGRRCRFRRYRSGESIFKRDDEGREVFFILEGSVNIVDFSLAGREIAFASVAVGDSFGELAAIDGKPRSTSVVAAEATYLAILPQEPFIDLLKEHAEVTFRVLQRLAEIVRRSDLRIMEMSTMAATHRVYAELLRMAQPDAAVPDLWVVRPLPPLREIASRVSTTRETVARALGQLYPSGLLRRKGRNLYLMDRLALQHKVYAWQIEGEEKQKS